LFGFQAIPVVQDVCTDADDPNVWTGGVLQEENLETAALGLVWGLFCQARYRFVSFAFPW